MKKERKYTKLIFQNIIQPTEKKILMIPNEKVWHYLAVTKLCIISRNNVKTRRSFLLFQLHPFLHNRK